MGKKRRGLAGVRRKSGKRVRFNDPIAQSATDPVTHPVAAADPLSQTAAESADITEEAKRLYPAAAPLAELKSTSPADIIRGFLQYVRQRVERDTEVGEPEDLGSLRDTFDTWLMLGEEFVRPSPEGEDDKPFEMLDLLAEPPEEEVEQPQSDRDETEEATTYENY